MICRVRLALWVASQVVLLGCATATPLRGGSDALEHSEPVSGEAAPHVDFIFEVLAESLGHLIGLIVTGQAGQ